MITHLEMELPFPCQLFPLPAERKVPFYALHSKIVKFFFSHVHIQTFTYIYFHSFIHSTSKIYFPLSIFLSTRTYSLSNQLNLLHPFFLSAIHRRYFKTNPFLCFNNLFLFLFIFCVIQKFFSHFFFCVLRFISIFSTFSSL